MRKTLGENIAWTMLLIVMVVSSGYAIYSVEHGTSIEQLAKRPAEFEFRDHRVVGRLSFESAVESGSIWELHDSQGNTIDIFISDGSSIPVKTGDEVEALGYWTEKDGNYLLFVKNLGVLAQ